MKITTAKYILITGSAGLIGSEATKFFIKKGFTVHGVDNNMREYFFGPEASTQWNRRLLEKTYTTQYIHHKVDIRDQKAIEKLFKATPFDLIIHTAAQPSHDWAAKEPMTDFGINAVGTLTMLEAYRKYASKAVFIFTSTNKVYGDNPNLLPLVEKKTRYELPKGHKFYKGIDESMSLDQTTHSIFGVSKAAADLMVQEYGRYFGLKTGVFRGGCLTGPAHSATKLHGFLAYLARCIYRGDKYTIYGYKCKQVRDNIHSYDLVNAFYHFYKKPRKGEVYNMGGSRYSNISMLEAIGKIEKLMGKKANIKYVKENRIGDHIWYISDVSKFKKHYPKWDYKYDIDAILKEICLMGHFT
jgi:CDP-paratose 2-epimerase